ncbi:MAG: hypothetical protein HC853_07440 [Anaerolineae bacterium]|nr:hypothetical protein [Anaerolineae bacterium]
MATQEERLRILRMIEENKISAEEGAKLIAALAASRRTEKGDKDERKASYTGQRARGLRIRVTNSKTGKQHVNINLPIGLVDIGLKIAARFSPELNGLDSEVVRAIKEGTMGKILDVTDEDDGDRVEIFVE